MKKQEVYDALKQVIDPELGINVVDLGLVYGVNIQEQVTSDKKQVKFRVKIVMTLTTPGCPLAGMIDFLIRDVVGSLPEVGEDNVEVELTFDPPWTAEMMSEEAKVQLGYD